MQENASKVYAKELVSLSLCDYLSEPATVIFFSGCNFDCGYCQNWRLKKISDSKSVDLVKIKDLIRKNRLISACKITGGEPLLQLEALKALAKFVKSLGLKLGIDTNGSLPEALEEILPLLDLISIDIKTSLVPGEYSKITGLSTNIQNIRRTLAIALSSMAFIDIRMVVIPGYNDSPKIVAAIGVELKALGYDAKAKNGKASFTLVEYLPENTRNEEFKAIKNPSVESLKSLAKLLKLENVRITHRALGFYIRA